MSDLTTAEHEMLRSFHNALSGSEWDYVPAYYAVGGPVTKEHRTAIKSLRLKGLLDFARGGQDDEGRLIGGTFYGVTEAGLAALNAKGAP